MRYIRYAILAVLTVIAVTFALANTQTVEINTLPEGLLQFPGAEMFSYKIEVRLFFVFFAFLAAGFFIGDVFEYLREHKDRKAARKQGKHVRRLQRELKKTQTERDKDKDEVLAILDQAS